MLRRAVCMSKKYKVKSFTLSELLVVIIITAIVVGLAFSILNLVQKQISSIEKNYKMKTELQLLEQTLWQDFNTCTGINYNDKSLILQSTIDTVRYKFNDTYILRNSDTLKIKAVISKLYNHAKEVPGGPVDAISISAEAEFPNYFIFVYSRHDAAYYINQDGF